MNWTEEQYREYLQRKSSAGRADQPLFRRREPVPVDVIRQSSPLPPSVVALLKRPGVHENLPGQKNQWESQYSAMLDLRQLAAEIDWHGYERIKLQLAHRCYYILDELVLMPDGRFEAHEVKGFMRDDAAVKIKVAATMYPWITFKIIKKVDEAWTEKPVPAWPWEAA